MKSLIVFAFLVSCTGSAYAEDKSNAAMDPKKAEVMKAWMEASTPGPQHKMLAELVGKWTVSTKAWESESAKPVLSTGTSTFKSVLGGHFVQQDFKGKMMNMPYEGTGMMGYNNISKKFESTWHDNMSTAGMFFEGTFNEATKTYSEAGEFDCPMKPTKQKMRSEMKMIDQNNFTFTLYMADMVTGKEFKSMEQDYKRMK